LSFLAAARVREWFRQALDAVRAQFGFQVWAYVLMPEHAHRIVYPGERAGTNVTVLANAQRAGRPQSRGLLESERSGVAGAAGGSGRPARAPPRMSAAHRIGRMMGPTIQGLVGVFAFQCSAADTDAPSMEPAQMQLSPSLPFRLQGVVPIRVIVLQAVAWRVILGIFPCHQVAIAAPALPPKPLPIDVIKAWEDAGAVAGWISLEFGAPPAFREGAEGRDGEIPGFRLIKWKRGLLKEVPNPDRAFGIVLRADEIVDSDLKDLSQLPSVRYLDLNGRSRITAKGFKELVKLKDLRILRLSGTNVTDEVIKDLIGLERLEQFNLEQTNVTDACLDDLAKMTNLHAVNLFGAHGVGKDAIQVAKLRGLHCLDLGSIRVGNEALEEIAKFPELRWLRICAKKDSAQATAKLGNVKSLEFLDLELPGQGDSDVVLSGLSGLKDLRRLDVTGCGVSEAGLQSLAKLQNLESLRLCLNRETGAGLKQLAGLRRVDLCGAVTDEDLRSLRHLKRLEVLNLMHTRVLSDDVLASISELTELRELRVYSNKGITDAGLKHIAELNKLEVLDLTDTQVSDAGMEVIAGFKELRNLSLQGTGVTDKGTQNLARLKNLEQLNLSGTQITDSCFKSLGELEKLRELHVPRTLYNNSGPLENLRALLSARPKLSVGF
jgi:Leucine-rich repeat (LRR) protein